MKFETYLHQKAGYVPPKIGDYVLCTVKGNESFFSIK